MTAIDEYETLRSAADADPRVVGLVVFGSRGADAYVTERSDVDVLVVVNGDRDDAQPWQTAHGSPVEAWAMTVEEFRDHAMPGTATAWNRPAFLRIRVDLDRLGGEIAALAARKAGLDPDEAQALAFAATGEAANALYRALRNLEAGRDLEGRLDALEACPPLLTAAFAMEDRVRPFNKWLRLDLAERPLGMRSAALVAAATALASEPTIASARAAFRALEAAARAAGHDAVIDDWEPDVAWLRGDAPPDRGQPAPPPKIVP